MEILSQLKSKKLKFVVILIAAFIVLYITMHFATPYYLRWSMGRKLSDKPILNLAPEQQLVPSVDADYLSLLNKQETSKFELCLPKGFKLYKEKNREKGGMCSFIKKDGDDSTGVIIISYEQPGFFMGSFDSGTVEKLKKLNIRNDYDYFGRVISARKEDTQNLLDAVFITIKDMISPRLGDEENLKIYKYESDQLRGYVSANVTDLQSDFSCDLFDNKNNYLHLMIRARDPILSLEQLSTIISTIKIK